jgi:hypothetical protein
MWIHFSSQLKKKKKVIIFLSLISRPFTVLQNNHNLKKKYFQMMCG